MKDAIPLRRHPPSTAAAGPLFASDLPLTERQLPHALQLQVLCAVEVQDGAVERPKGRRRPLRPLSSLAAIPTALDQV